MNCKASRYSSLSLCLRGCQPSIDPPLLLVQGHLSSVLSNVSESRSHNHIDVDDRLASPQVQAAARYVLGRLKRIRNAATTTTADKDQTDVAFASARQAGGAVERGGSGGEKRSGGGGGGAAAATNRDDGGDSVAYGERRRFSNEGGWNKSLHMYILLCLLMCECPAMAGSKRGLE